uniref:Uncharacterized protein n=2 Tax=Phaeomonas parva TaxID=124430 RepID=A0A7S1XVU5_9STRA|mmetsp:Transcript_37996/g.119260  ORF Transcript_37996/g.119260 Transcript_37996/m.119260 type:complete len:147 (+) Transcript_37996:503-943(+)
MMSKSFELPSLAEARATHAEEAQARGWTMANVNSAGEIIVDAMDEDTPPAADAAAAATPGKAKDMEADDDATAATDAATATATAPAAATAEEEAAAWSDLRELGWRLGAPLAKSKTDQWGTKVPNSNPKPNPSPNPIPNPNPTPRP